MIVGFFHTVFSAPLLARFPCAGGRARRRGVVTVEYVVLLSTVALGLTVAVAALGVPLVRTYLKTTAQLALPFP
jgi:hypothetical protein